MGPSPNGWRKSRRSAGRGPTSPSISYCASYFQYRTTWQGLVGFRLHSVRFTCLVRAIIGIAITVAQESSNGAPVCTSACRHLTADWKSIHCSRNISSVCSLNPLSLFASAVALRCRLAALSDVASHSTHPSLPRRAISARPRYISPSSSKSTKCDQCQKILRFFT